MYKIINITLDMVLTKETHNATKIELARDLGARSLNGLKKPLLPLLNKILGNFRK